MPAFFLRELVIAFVTGLASAIIVATAATGLEARSGNAATDAEVLVVASGGHGWIGSPQP